MSNLFGEPDPAPMFDPGPREPNPCVRVYGYGPEGAKCKDCTHLDYHRPSLKRYYKCLLRKITAGPGTDHRVGWRACGKWETR